MTIAHVPSSAPEQPHDNLGSVRSVFPPEQLQQMPPVELRDTDRASKPPEDTAPLWPAPEGSVFHQSGKVAAREALAPIGHDTFGGVTDEEMTNRIAEDRQSRADTDGPLPKAPFANLRTPYRDARRPSAENRFRTSQH